MSRRVAAVVLLVLLSGCAKHYTAEAAADPYGFFSGLWHGWLCPWSIMGSVLSWVLSLLGLDVLSSVEIIGRPNTGFGYYAGFAMGVLSYGGAKGR